MPICPRPFLFPTHNALLTTIAPFVRTAWIWRCDSQAYKRTQDERLALMQEQTTLPEHHIRYEVSRSKRYFIATQLIL